MALPHVQNGEALSEARAKWNSGLTQTDQNSIDINTFQSLLNDLKARVEALENAETQPRDFA